MKVFYTICVRVCWVSSGALYEVNNVHTVIRASFRFRDAARRVACSMTSWVLGFLFVWGLYEG